MPATSRLFSPVLLILLALLTPALQRASHGLPAPGDPDCSRVVLITIDGIRNSEGFLLSVPPKIPHPYIPRIWAEIKPRATVFTNLLMAEKASTSRGLNTLYSGVWNAGPNRGHSTCACDPDFIDNRSLAPLVGEHLVKDLALPANAVAFYNGKPQGLSGDYSFHPAYGADHAPGINVFIDSLSPDNPFFEDRDQDLVLEFVDDLNGDDLLFDRMKADLAFSAERTEYPRLIVCHLGVVDLAGHKGQFPLYADAIRNVDDEIVAFWNFIESHPVYSGNTTLMVSTDHGRHDADHGGFQAHGGSCPGCRNLFFFAIGPQTPQGAVVTRTAFMVDIAPTAAALLGLTMPHAVGAVLPEVTGEVDAISTRILESRATAQGSNVVVTATRRDTNHEPRIERWQGTPDGDSLQFGPAAPVSDPGAILADGPTVTRSRRDTLLAAWRELASETDVWRIRLAESDDGGTTFSEPRNVLAGRREVEHEVGFRKPEAPAILSTPDGDVVFVPIEGHGRLDHVIYAASRTAFRSHPVFGVALRDDGTGPPAHFDMVDTILYPDGSVGLAWIQINRAFQDDPGQTKSWEVLYRRLTRNGAGPVVRITDDPGPSLFPRLLFDPVRRLVHLVYSTRIAGRSQVFVRSSTNGVAFDAPVALTGSAVGAWRPDLLADSSGDLLVVYEDHETGLGDVHAVQYFPAIRTVGSRTNLSQTALPSRNPSIVQIPDTGEVFVTWEELRDDGTFELKSTRVP